MNFIKNRIKTMKASQGLFISSGSEIAAQLAAECGFDFLLLDMEHGLGDENATLRQIEALHGYKSAPIVRIPFLRSEYIKRLLDFGAAGIMCPMIETVGDAENFVKAMRYPPRGIRGLSSGSRAASFGKDFKDYFKRADSELLGIAQIETRNALDNVDSIAAVDGIDILFIGHSDLSLSLDCHDDFECTAMLDAEKAVIKAAVKHGKIPGMLFKASMVRETYIAKGFSFLALGTDTGIMRAAFSKLLE